MVRSVHKYDSFSYSFTAIVREDRLGRPRTLLSDQPGGVTREYDDYLRVGIDLEMSTERYYSEWERLFVSPEVLLAMSIWFFAIFLPVFLICGFVVFEPALL